MTSIFKADITSTALAFRGYNTVNLGRSAELLACPAYRGIVLEELKRFSRICSEFLDQSTDLQEIVKSAVEPGLDRYAEAIALIVAMEVAQMRLLDEVHQVETSRAALAFGYSLGELVAVGFGGTFAIDDLIRVPLALSKDSVELANNIKMGVLFSRGPTIDETDVQRICQQITGEAKSTLGISAILSPNTYLLIGQGDTVDRFKEVMHNLLPSRAHLRINTNQWPPLHTPIVRQRNIADRASVMMETVPGGFTPPCPPVLSLVTGSRSYDDYSSRQILREWIDHPQRLWDAIDKTLELGVKTVIHVGPIPNVIPATYHRLSENILEQTSGKTWRSLRKRAVSGMARRPWLASLLPSDTALLRAPHVRHIILEDWLLENSPTS